MVGQTLANEALQQNICPHGVVDLQVLASVAAQIKLRQIALQMRLIDVLIDADQTPRLDRKEVFEVISMYFAANVFAFAVVNAFIGLIPTAFWSDSFGIPKPREV